MADISSHINKSYVAPLIDIYYLMVLPGKYIVNIKTEEKYKAMLCQYDIS